MSHLVVQDDTTIETLTRRIRKRYKKGKFTNNPIPHPDAKPIDIVYYTSSDTLPYLSIIMPIHNQEQVIVKHMESIFTYTTETPYEVLLILDACSDNTQTLLLEFFSHFESYPELCTRILVCKSETPLFETTCDNIGLYCAKGTYVIEIQADMEMTEKGYNQRLLQPFVKDNMIIGISGRCCHGLKNNSGVGKLGTNIEQPLPNNMPRDVYFIGETCNRGPLALDIQKVRKLGYLDEVNYFLDNSDHDLFARAFVQHNWICGYVPIEFNTKLENGSTRKPRNAMNQLWFERKQEQTRGGQDGFLRQFIMSPIPSRPIQVFLLQ